MIETGVVKREDVFITTKLWCSYHTRVEENLDRSLKALGLQYVYLYLMHWPAAMNPEGKCRSFRVPRATISRLSDNRPEGLSRVKNIADFVKGNDGKFPTLPDRTHDLVLSRSHAETYKDMEKLLDI